MPDAWYLAELFEIRTYLLRKISVCGFLDQDLSVRISASGSCGTTRARSLYSDFLRKIPILMQDLCVRISAAGSCRHLCKIIVSGSLVQNVRVRNSASESCIGPLVGDPLPDYKSATYLAFLAMDAHDLRKGCAWKSENATLPAFHSMDMHDLRRRLHLEIRKRDFTSTARSTQ